MKLNSKYKDFKLKIILVEPSGQINIGSVARLCLNFNVDKLAIVNPKCDIYSIETKKMALKGIHFINECSICTSINDAINDCDLVFATSGKSEYAKESNCDSLKNLRKYVESYKKVKILGVIFGREDRGLTNKELLLANKVFTIGTNSKFLSLNLSHAVSIFLYEFFRNQTIDNELPDKIIEIASSKQIEDSFSEIERLLLKSGYILPHTASAKISKFKKFIHRAETSKHEINILRGIVHQINWALENPEKV